MHPTHLVKRKRSSSSSSSRSSPTRSPRLYDASQVRPPAAGKVPCCARLLHRRSRLARVGLRRAHFCYRHALPRDDGRNNQRPPLVARCMTCNRCIAHNSTSTSNPRDLAAHPHLAAHPARPRPRAPSPVPGRFTVLGKGATPRGSTSRIATHVVRHVGLYHRWPRCYCCCHCCAADGAGPLLLPLLRGLKYGVGSLTGAAGSIELPTCGQPKALGSPLLAVHSAVTCCWRGCSWCCFACGALTPVSRPVHRSRGESSGTSAAALAAMPLLPAPPLPHSAGLAAAAADCTQTGCHAPRQAGGSCARLTPGTGQATLRKMLQWLGHGSRSSRFPAVRPVPCMHQQISLFTPAYPRSTTGVTRPLLAPWPCLAPK